MKAKIALLFVVILLCGCRSQVKNIKTLKYIKDDRADICYSVLGDGNSYSHSAVDCTPLVLKAIEEDTAEVQREY